MLRAGTQETDIVSPKASYGGYYDRSLFRFTKLSVTLLAQKAVFAVAVVADAPCTKQHDEGEAPPDTRGWGFWLFTAE